MNSNQDKTSVENIEDDIIFNEEDDETIPEPKFEVKRFTINKDVYFDIEIAYVAGHPIVKTKTLKLYYHSDKPENMSSQGKLASSLMGHGRKTKFAINLLNYLCRFINGFNLFHCYIQDDINTSKEELQAFITHENQDTLEEEKASIFTNVGADERSQKGKFSFLNGIIKHREIDEDLVNQYRDSRLPEVIPNLKDLHHIPIWTYVHPSLVKNQGSTVHICHFAFLLERLAHNDNYPEFNNAAALALLNVTQESDETALTVETINENRYNHMVERKTFYKKAYKEEKSAHAETQAKLNTVIDQNAQLLRKNDELIQINKDQTEQIRQQSSMIDSLQSTAGILVNLNYDQTDKIDTLMDMNYNTKCKLNDMNNELKYRDKKIDLMDKKIGWVVHEVGKLPMRSIKTDGTNDILVLYTSQHKPVDRGRKPLEEDGQIWIASYNGDEYNYKFPNVPEDAHEIYRVQANRLNSFKKLVENTNVKAFILNVYDRSLLINEESIDDFLNAVDEALNEGGQFESVKHLEVLHSEIEERKIERQRRKDHQEFLDLKRKIIETYKTPHVYLSSRKRLVYIENINEDGNRSLIPLADCEIEIAVKHQWRFKFGANGIHDDILEETAIKTGKWYSDGDSRIKYEN